MSTPTRSLVDDYFWFLFDRKGKMPLGATNNFRLAGIVLCELALRGQIAVQADGSLAVTDSATPEDLILRDALRLAHMGELNPRGRNMHGNAWAVKLHEKLDIDTALRERWLQSGRIHLEEKRGLFGTAKTYILNDETPRALLRDRLHAIAAGQPESSNHERILFLLLGALSCEDNSLFEGMDMTERLSQMFPRFYGAVPGTDSTIELPGVRPECADSIADFLLDLAA